MTPRRLLVYRFFELNYISKSEILVKLGIIKKCSDFDDKKHVDYFMEIEKQNKLFDFWEMVKSEEGNEDMGENPFDLNKYFKTPEFQEAQTKIRQKFIEIKDIIENLNKNTPASFTLKWVIDTNGTLTLQKIN